MLYDLSTVSDGTIIEALLPMGGFKALIVLYIVLGLITLVIKWLKQR